MFAAENIAALEHFFQNITIANIGTGKRDAFACEDSFEAQIGHGSGDDAIARELALRFKVTGYGEENSVSIDDFSISRDEEGAISVAVKGDSESGSFGRDALLKLFEMERAAAGIDVAPVGLCAYADNVAAERFKKFGPELVSGSIGAIEYDAKAF